MSNDKNNLVYREQLDDNVIEMLSEDIGNNYSLRTENTKTIVAALNEILGKDIICNAVGSPLLTTDTFNIMGEKIKGLTADFKSKLLALGVSVSSVDKLEALVTKLGEIDLGVDAEELLGTYEDSLKEILKENGIEVNDNESLADLIIKVNNTLNAKEEKDAENKQLLIDALINNGIKINGDESFSELLDMIEIKDGRIVRNNDIAQIVCSEGGYTCAIKNDGSLWFSGYDEEGESGIGFTETSYRTFNQVVNNINNDVQHVGCGENHTIIAKTDGSIWSCGYNYSGELGLGTSGSITGEKTFTQVTSDINSSVKQIICRGYIYDGFVRGKSIILANDGSLWACGYNKYGELGLVMGKSYTTFTQVTTNINNDVKQVACGIYHTMIIKNDGSLWACGNNEEGQLGLGDTKDRGGFFQVTTNINNDVKQVACGTTCTFILKNDGSVWACGEGFKGQLGLGDTDNRTTFTQVTTNINNDVKQIACGGDGISSHVFILKTDGSLWATGYNRYGQLGLGTSDTNNHSTFTQVTTNINNDVKEVICGEDTSFIIKNDGSVWACGYNSNGQLGLNDKTNRNTFTKTFEYIAIQLNNR